MSEQARIETAIDTTIDNCEVLRARLAKYEDADGKPKAQPSGVDSVDRIIIALEAVQSAMEDAYSNAYQDCCGRGNGECCGNPVAAWSDSDQAIMDALSPAQRELSALLASAALSANHSEQVLEGWQLVPVEPIDAMLEAGDKYIGTPATYKAMLSACPSPAITKDFSQFLSAVMDAAGLIRHGRQSKELSEYLGMKCMEYRGAERAAPSHGEQVREVGHDGWRQAVDNVSAYAHLYNSGFGIIHEIRAEYARLLAAAPSAGSHGGDV